MTPPLHHALSRVCAILVLFFWAERAAAQAPAPVEVSAGYQYLVDIKDGLEFSTFDRGLFASAAWNVTARLALVGEVSRSAKTTEVGESSRFGPVKETLSSAVGGVRLRFGGIFVQTLIGQFAARTVRELLLGTEDQTITDLVVQPGVGFDFARVGRVGGRVVIDYRKLLSNDSEFDQEIRIGVGATVGLGGR